MAGGAVWLAIMLVAGIFCLARGVVDLTQRRYFLGILGLVIGCAIFALPIQSHAVKLDLPPPQR